MRIVQIFRGMLKTAITWSFAWIPLSLLPMGIALLFDARLPRADFLRLMVTNAALSGAINGLLFSAIVAIAGRNKTFERIGLGWIALCGAVASVLLLSVGQFFFDPGIPTQYVVRFFATNAVLGATCAAGSLAIARRAPGSPQIADASKPALNAGAA